MEEGAVKEGVVEEGVIERCLGMRTCSRREGDGRYIVAQSRRESWYQSRPLSHMASVSTYMEPKQPSLLLLQSRARSNTVHQRQERRLVKQKGNSLSTESQRSTSDRVQSQLQRQPMP